MSTNKREKAIVIGASMAGLMAARVCANHFKEVIILEKDHLSNQTLHRRGVPQGHQLHLVLAKGLDIISAYFPDLIPKLIEKGATYGDMGKKLQWFAEGGMRPQCETGLNTIMLSRPLLENTVREELLKFPNVKLISGTEITDFIQVQKSINGVRTKEKDYRANLIIDSRGMVSDLTDVLKELDFEEPEVEKVRVNVRYTSCTFPKPKDYDTLLNINTSPPFNSKHGTIQPIENNRILVMLQGRSNDKAPRNVNDFKLYAKELESPEVYHTIKDLEPESEVFGFRIPYVRWIHFENLKSFPEGILPLGDAICRLNPVYGQGMTSASIQAKILDKVLLESGNTYIWREYFKSVAKAIKSPWEMTLSEDFKFPETEGIAPKMPGIMVKYFNKLNRVMNSDPIIYKNFLKVLNMSAGPLVLLRPNILYRVIKAK